MIKLHKIEIRNELDPLTQKGKNDNLTVEARLLQKKFFNKSPREQLKFFENVVELNLKNKVYEEEIASIKTNGGVSS